MAGGAERLELRPQLRHDPLPPATAMVLRGGPDTLSLIRAHARRTQRLYCLDGSPLWGVSVFGALDHDGPTSYEGLLAGRLETYLLVHAATVGTIMAAGFELLPSFRRPHFTIRLANDSIEEAGRLLDAMGSPEENPYNREVGRRQGETPL